MAIGNHNDLTHIVRTSDQWKNTYDKYELIPTGVLCVELVSSDVTKIKIGDGHNIFSKLPYIGDLDLSKYYTKLETDTRIKEILTQEKVVRIKGLVGSKSDLPADARCGDIYFVRQLSSSDNKYIEYIYSPDNTWEPLGGIPVDIDLSEYAKTAYVDDKIEQVNERIDDIEQHGTHTHSNKEILDQITEPYTTADKETLASLHNYDDTEIREMISQSSHTHSNKDILDATSAAFTKEDKSKLDQLNPYDDSTIKERITELERVAHEHSNKRILDQTTASFTKEYERKMRWIRMYTGCTGMEEGIAGLVPAAQAGEEDYVLSGSGEWVPQTGGGGTYELPIATTTTLGGIKVGDGLEIDANGKLSVVGGGGGGDTVTEGGGISITTDPQTGDKVISVNVGDNLEVDQVTGELNVTGVDYTAGKGIYIGADYKNVEYIKNGGNYDQVILTDIIPDSSDKLEMDIKFGAASNLSTNKAFIGRANYGSGVVEKYGYTIWCSLTSSNSNLGFYNKFIWTAGMPSSNMLDHAAGIDYTGTNSVRTILIMQGATASWGETPLSFSDCIDNTFIEVTEPIALFGQIDKNDVIPYDCGEITLYGVKWYDSNDTLLHNLVPVKRLSDNAGGLYDTITQKFYGNSGNGSFITGPETTPSDDRIINAKIGNGLQFDSNNAIEVNVGSGLQFDANGAIEVTETGVDFVPGDGLEMVQEGYFDRLPLETYSHCDYVENTNDARCQINYTPPQTVRVVGKFSPVQTLADAPLFGSRSSSSTGGHQFVLWCSAPNNTLPYTIGFVSPGNSWGTSSEANSGRSVSFVQNDIINFDIDFPNTQVLINDEVLQPIAVSSSTVATINLGIFAIAKSNTPTWENKFCGKIYGIKFYEGNALVVNLVPAVRDSDSVVGFYDNVNDVFYTSITSTAFVTDTSTITKDEPSTQTVNVLNVIPATSGNIGGIIPRRALTVDLKGRLDVDLATSTTPGIITPKEGLNVDANGELTVAKATSSTMGGIKVGSGFIYTLDGTLNAEPAMHPFEVGDGLELVYDSEDALPTGYGYVDYVWSNPSSKTSTSGNNSIGRAYTKIDYIPTNATRIIATFENWSYQSDSCIVGSRYAGSDQEFELWFEPDSSSSTEAAFIYGGTGYTAGKVACSYTLRTRVTLEGYLENGSANLKINGTLAKTYSYSGNISPYKLGIFRSNKQDNGSWEYNPTNAKIYSIKIYEGDTLAVNLIPAVRLVDEVVGFYDNVSDKFYTSVTSYPFITDMSTLVIDGVPRTMNVVPATANTIGGIKVGDGLSIESDGTLSVVGGSGGGNYSAGDAIEFETATDTHDIVWNMLQMSHTWVNKAYTAHVGGIFTNDSLCVHSDITPISNLFSIPQNATIYTIEARDQNDNLLHCIVDYHDGAGNHLDWNGEFISDPTKQYTSLSSAIYISVGVVNTDHSTPLAISAVKSVTLTWKNVTETSTEINVKYGNGLTLNASNELEVDLPVASDSTLGGIIVGDGLSVDENGVLDGVVYEPGPGIEMYTSSSTTFRVDNPEYYFEEAVACQINDGGSSRTYTRTSSEPAIAATTVVTVSGHDSYGMTLIGLTETAAQYKTSHDNRTLGPNTSFEYKGYTWYITKDYELTNSTGVDMLGNLEGPINLRTIDTTGQQNLDLVGKALIDLAGVIVEVNPYEVWDSSTWLNGAYNDAQSDQFWTNWYYTYHSKQNEYFELPEWATKMRLIGISNENDSRFEGGGVDCFNSSHHHFTSIGCVTDEWADIPAGTVYVQFGVKWNELNNRTISSSDIKSVTFELFRPLPDNTISAKIGNGLEFDSNDAIKAKLGNGLGFDSNGAIEVTGGGGGDTIAEGDGIEITTDQQTGVKTIGVNIGNGLEIDPITGALNVTGSSGGGSGDYSAGEAIDIRQSVLTNNIDAIRWDISTIKTNGGAWTQVRYVEFCDSSGTAHTLSTGSGIWEDGTAVTYSHDPAGGGSQEITDMIADTRKMCAAWRGPGHTLKLTFILDTATAPSNIVKFRMKTGDDEVGRDPKAWKIYVRDSVTQRWYLVHETENAEITDTRSTWSNYYNFSTPSDTSINVKYGTGLSVDPITNELFVNGQLPEGTIIKKLTYTGTGTDTNNIQFNKKPLAILSLNGSSGQNYGSLIPTFIDSPYLHGVYGGPSNSGTTFRSPMSYNDSTNVLSITNTSDEGLAFNIVNKPYVMYYLTKGHTGSGTSATNEVSVIKSFTYVGDGTNPNNIQFPETPDMLVTISAPGGDNTRLSAAPSAMDADKLVIDVSDANNNNGVIGCSMSFNSTTNVLTLSTTKDISWCLNMSGTTYTVFYAVNEVISNNEVYDYIAGEGISIKDYSDILPEGYTAVKALKSTGNQYIDTGYIIKANTSFEIQCKIYETSRGWTFPLGTRNSSNAMMFCTEHWSSGSSIEYWLQDGDATATAAERSVFYNEPVVITINDNVLTCVNQTTHGTVTLTVTGKTMPSNIPYPLYVFATNDTGSVAFYGDMELYSLKILESGTVVHEYIPCLNSNNVAGLYDIYTDTFKTSPNGNAFFYISGTPTGEEAIKKVQLKKATTSTLGGVIVGDGLSVDSNGELEVNIGTGLAFDPQTGAINVTGGGGGSGDTVAEGAGIEITTDQQTGNKVIAINPGAGLQVNQTTNELEVSSGVVTSIAPTQNTPGSITVTEGDGTTTPVSVISQMGGATSSTAGTAGYVPAPASGDDDAYLRGDGTWDDSVLTEDDELTLVFVPDDYQPS